MAGCSTTPDTNYSPLAEQAKTELATWESPVLEGQATTLNQLIPSPELDKLVQQALDNNPDLQQSLLTLKIYASEYNQSKKSRYPTAEASINGSNDEEDGSSSSADVTISWELDLWRQAANEQAVTAKTFLSQTALYQASQDSLAANVMKSWLAVIAQQRALQVEQERNELLSKNEQLIMNRYRNGYSDLEGLDSARSSTASSHATIVSYEESLAAERRALIRLLGVSRWGDLSVPNEYPDVLLPLVELPEQTLGRRPDLQSAYHLVEAADTGVKVAYKDMLPSISLDVSLYTDDATPLSNLLTSPFWYVLGELSQPIFQAGELKSALEVAKHEAAQAYQTYRSTLLDAVLEVENALSLEKALTKQQEYLEQAFAAEKNNLQQYQRNFLTGSVDIIDLLSVQQGVFDLSLQLDDVIYERLVNRIDLGLALGLGVKP